MRNTGIKNIPPNKFPENKSHKRISRGANNKYTIPVPIPAVIKNTIHARIPKMDTK